MKIGVFSGGTGGAAIARQMRSAWTDLSMQSFESAQFCFIETNWETIRGLVRSGVPKQEIMLLTSDKLNGHGSYHKPELAAAALKLKRDEIMKLMKGCTIIFVVVTGGKGTGMGTFLLLCQMAKEAGAWVFPVFAEPSPDVEVDITTHNQVKDMLAQVKKSEMRLLHIVNQRVFSRSSNRSKDESFTLINKSIGGSLGVFAQMLAEGQKIDLSDMAQMLAGDGHLYLGHSHEVLPTDYKSTQHSGRIRKMVADCMDISFLNFGGKVDHAVVGITAPEDCPAWVEGEFGNAVSAAIKQKYQALPKHSLPPTLFPVGHQVWGVTVLLSDHTGEHEPLTLPKINMDLDAIEVETEVETSEKRSSSESGMALTLAEEPDAPEATAAQEEAAPSTKNSEPVSKINGTASVEEVPAFARSMQEVPQVEEPAEPLGNEYGLCDPGSTMLKVTVKYDRSSKSCPVGVTKARRYAQLMEVADPSEKQRAEQRELQTVIEKALKEPIEVPPQYQQVREEKKKAEVKPAKRSWFKRRNKDASATIGGW